MGGLFSFPFNKGFKPIMDMYGLTNSDLTEDTFAKVFIEKIKITPDATNKDKIDILKSFLKAIYSKIGQSPPLDKNNNGRKLGATSTKNQDIKDWIERKKDDYKKEIFDAIEALKPAEAAALSPAVGGSRKKYKKSPAAGGSRKKSKKSRS